MIDLLLDSNNDLMIADNDLVIGESTEQHQYLLMLCNKGDFKENPLSCVGIAEWLKDNDISGCLAEIKTQFQKDGMNVNSITYDGTNIIPDANY